MLTQHLAAKETVHALFRKRVIAFWLRDTGFSRSIRGRIGPDCSEMSARQSTLSEFQIQVCGRCHNRPVENTTLVPKLPRASLIVRHVFPKREFGMRTKNGIH